MNIAVHYNVLLYVRVRAHTQTITPTGSLCSRMPTSTTRTMHSRLSQQPARLTAHLLVCSPPPPPPLGANCLKSLKQKCALSIPNRSIRLTHFRSFGTPLEQHYMHSIVSRNSVRYSLSILILIIKETRIGEKISTYR